MRCLFRRIRAQAPEGPRMQDILFSLFRGVVCDLSPREVNVRIMTFMKYYVLVIYFFHSVRRMEDHGAVQTLSSVATCVSTSTKPAGGRAIHEPRQSP